jgi:short-subunit dehydrogenase
MSHSSPKTVLITGAASGIGRACAHRLAALGHPLSLIDVQSDELKELVKEIKGFHPNVSSETADVRDQAALHRAVRKLESHVGLTDVLLASAGVGSLSSIHDLDLDGLQRMLEINVVGVARSIQAVLPGMVERRSGHILGMSSVASFRGLPWMPGYSASKAALSAYLEGLRPAFKLRGIRITTICPGFVRTAMTSKTPFRKPVPMLSPEQAALYIARAIRKRPRTLVFPMSARFGMGLLRQMPDRLFDWTMDRIGPTALTTEF